MRFRVRRAWFIGAVVGPLAVWSAWLAWVRFPVADALLVFLFTIAVATTMAWLATLTQVVDISERGLVLYHVNRTTWSDVVAAQRTRILGFEYIKLRLRSGRAWWLPLFFRGDVVMSSALQKFAPEGHPVRSCLSAPKAG